MAFGNMDQLGNGGLSVSGQLPGATAGLANQGNAQFHHI